MGLTEINKLTYVVVLLLPLLIQAQVNEFTFSVSNNNTRINVIDAQEIKFTCITGPSPSPSLATLDRANRLVFIAFMNKLQHGFSEQYDYTTNNTNLNTTEHILTVKYVDGHEQYYCFTGTDMYVLHLNVLKTPEQPSCTVLQNTGATLTCESELGDPEIAMVISDSDKIYAPTLTISNDTHITQNVNLTKYTEAITCNTTYTFMQNDMKHSINYSCVFDINTFDDSSRVVDGPSNASTTAKYTIFTLVMAVLSRVI